MPVLKFREDKTPFVDLGDSEIRLEDDKPSEAIVQKGVVELRETPEVIQAAIIELREMVKGKSNLIEIFLVILTQIYIHEFASRRQLPSRPATRVSL